MKIALFGTGQMGKAIAHMIKKISPLHVIHSWDACEIPHGMETDQHTVCDLREITEIPDVDLAISSLPYHLNTSVAKVCIESKISYCDLGGSVPVSKEINKLAKENDSVVFTDLGLAPGWANIMAEKALTLFPDRIPHTIKMRCGGLPSTFVVPSEDPFNYKLTWSIEGLHNEYIDDCKILVDGEIVTVPSLSETEIVRIKGFPSLEAFTTSGGASHTLSRMREAGVRHCSYKTLRTLGHLDLITYFLKEKKFNAEQMSLLFKDSSAHEKDQVILEVEALYDDITYRKTHVIKAEDGYSAMQRATAGGLVSAIFSSPAKWGGPLNYRDIDISQFNSHMIALGIID
jgi:saccharopine dehydrogenase-like NADP-dependent oxidoreductase